MLLILIWFTEKARIQRFVLEGESDKKYAYRVDL